MKTEKDLFIEITEHFKDAVDIISLGGSKMIITDFDFGNLEISCADVWIKSYKNNRFRILYNIITKEYAKIISKMPQGDNELESSFTITITVNKTK